MGEKLYFKYKENDMHRRESRKSIVPQREENKANVDREGEGREVFMERANKTKVKEMKG